MTFRLAAPTCGACLHPLAEHRHDWCDMCGCRASTDPAPTCRHTSSPLTVWSFRRPASAGAKRGWVRTLLARRHARWGSRGTVPSGRPVSTRPRSHPLPGGEDERGRVDHLRWVAGTLAAVLLLAVAVSVANGEAFGPVEFVLTVGAGAYVLWAVGVAR